MKRILEILTLSLFVTLALNVWADDYVDDVYYSPQPKTPQTPLKGEGLNESKTVSQSVSEVKEDGKITIEYLPQTADTVVVIRVKK